MSGSPQELPAEFGTGGGGTIDWSRIRGGIGGPNELPVEGLRLSASELVREVFRLRDRVHVLESSALSSRLAPSTAVTTRSFFTGVGGPNELPEGEGGGGGGVFHPIHEIAELPISRLASELSAITARLTQFETTVAKQLEAIQAGIAKRAG